MTRDVILGRVFQSTSQCCVVLDLDGNIREANQSFSSLVGLTNGELLGHSLSNFLEWEQLTLSQAMETASESTSCQSRVMPFIHQPDQTKSTHFWGSLTAARDEQGKHSHYVVLLTDVTKIEGTQKKLHRQALHDTLTSLPNRRYFRQRITELIECDRDASQQFAVCFLDLDDFKVVNDTLGHEAGDELLISVAERIKACIYRDCFLARIGGDEFALLIPIPENNPDRLNDTAKQVVTALNEPFALGENQVYIGASIGISCFPANAMDANSLIRHADVAMYHAKDVGKNTVRFFTPVLAAEMEFGRKLLNDLRRDVNNCKITVAYQPKLDLKTDNLAGCEALVRWTRDGKPVCPAQFIEAAEKSGLILPLGDQIIRQVMEQAKQWHSDGTFKKAISINVSPRQISDPEFFGRFKQLLADTGAQPEWLELEITENAVMENLTNSVVLMSRFSELGVKISIDNFGTGYSSLCCLKDLPVSTLKIDLSFVHELPFDPGAVAVARTILSLGNGLGLNVVAEGVESDEQRQFLQSEGCEMIQGYLVSRPLAADEFALWVLERNSDR